MGVRGPSKVKVVQMTNIYGKYDDVTSNQAMVLTTFNLYRAGLSNGRTMLCFLDRKGSFHGSFHLWYPHPLPRCLHF